MKRTIFILIDWFSPAYKAGGPITSITNLVNSFSDNIIYRIICSNTDLDKKVLKNIVSDSWIDYNQSTKIWYCSNNIYSFRVLKRELKSSDSAILFINGIYSFYFNVLPIIFFNKYKKIISPRGMLNAGALSQKSLKKIIYLKFLKLLRIDKKCVFHASSIEEKEYIKSVFGRESKICIAENFPRKFNQQILPFKKVNVLQLVSLSLISPMKNHLNTLEALKNCQGQIIYNIYGPIKDSEYWDKCLKCIDQLPSHVTVTYHSDIQPSEVNIALMQNQVFIQPSKSENFGHSIFEALTIGLPVITSHNTPWNNLKDRYAGLNVDGENILEISAAINFFSSMAQDQLSSWHDGAATYAENAINFYEIKEKYTQLFDL